MKMRMRNAKRRGMENQDIFNEKGIALLMVLVLSAISLTIMAGLIYMITSGTQISGVQKRYKTALEAGTAGIGVTYQFIGRRGDPDIPNIAFSFSTAFSTACRANKLNNPTFISNTYNWTACANQDQATSMTIDPGTPSTFDMSFVLGTYTTYAKIVDTVEGNTGGDEEGLLKHGVVSAGSGEITVMSIPYLYTVEVQSENTTNSAEKAKLSVLYQY